MVCSRGLDGEEGTDIVVAAMASALKTAMNWLSVMQVAPTDPSGSAVLDAFFPPRHGTLIPQQGSAAGYGDENENNETGWSAHF